ncbi:MAG: Coenzyme F420 hydrogenase/dehydrogenase, beta subunit C-terminal domain [Muribaculaceae bacterium]|nr:Coenzyme F420 hydrogenase/dehydrogenase, beta subunit C-terminal domain [Muribaculaceae bacterium]
MVNESNISVLNHDDCCGCKACGDVCPKSCISFCEDKDGFMYPHVDEVQCISCKKCQRICPELKPSYNTKNASAIAAFALNQEARSAGSSGGIFGLLAQEIIKKGGKVWGAAFDSDLQLHHEAVTNIEDLTALYRSKYIQSDPEGAYAQIKKDISEGTLTLFSGTPCQCNAIKNFIGKSDLLITVEVICHGVPPQSLFNKLIAYLERQNHYKITSFAFRSKSDKALHPQSFTYVCDNGKRKMTVNGLHYQFPYYFGFQKYITLRPSCYLCKWAKPERTADITLGDFWGIEKYDSSLDAKEGVSMIIVNTEAGKSLIESLENQKKIFTESFPINVAIENNGCLVSPTPLKKERDAFFKALNVEPLEDVIYNYLRPKRKFIFDIYYSLPKPLRQIVRHLMDKRMKYE